MPNGGSAISGNIATKRMFFIIKKKKRCLASLKDALLIMRRQFNSTFVKST
jgi:hypothetical protein